MADKVAEAVVAAPEADEVVEKASDDEVEVIKEKSQEKDIVEEEEEEEEEDESVSEEEETEEKEIEEITDEPKENGTCETNGHTEASPKKRSADEVKVSSPVKKAKKDETAEIPAESEEATA